MISRTYASHTMRLDIKRKRGGVWPIIVGACVVAALGLWWIAAGVPLDSWTPFVGGTHASSTPEAAASSTASAAPGHVTVVRGSKKTDVAAIVASIPEASRFNSLFRSSGVAATIGTGSGSSYTVFVPTNGAFAQLPAGTVSDMSTAEKLRLIQYHVVSGRAIDVDALRAGTVEALSRDALNFSFGTDNIPMVNSAIVVARYEGKNGVVYLIDNVLLPPKKQGL